ncbi:MAG TPA: methyltransferase [Kofleriaceae bacterium]|nr:methyltransferase [Kofleriaceae bacterium]
MDVFGFAVSAGGDFLRAAAIDAAYELGILPQHATASLDELATRAGLTRAGSRRRLARLVDVLAAIGALGAPPPPRPVVARAGWGLMADVIRSDRPLHPEGGEVELRYQLHLARTSADAARALVPHLGASPRSLVDFGGGAGTYVAPFLDAHPLATATLVDFGDVLAIARTQLADFGARVRYLGGDARAVPVGTGHGAVLLSNLLHLHGPAICAGLVDAAARAVAHDGVVIVKDLRMDEDRCGPLPGLLFALNMAIYTGEGDVYPVSQLRTWLTAAGLGRIEEHLLASAPDSVLLVARKEAAGRT